ncbi:MULTISPECIES: ATP-binding protein [unclassified Rubrivivax]|uniref:ATP-binding protein n=1 Tax=unclassified Rubrivivax TaxID=2649762 RepID=UPI001E32B6FF|nr:MULTISPECIES: ATP-binding protein [unclassified Rubrivivax]MCC9597961.1 HAMP domain-containing protein [Rubrivivax sp. JA1055]MCC9645782.1 HAMP domain-containing protein [Rubrivivax sp. JA1029]
MKLVGLSRQLAVWMGAVALGVAVLLTATSFVFYYVTFEVWPQPYSESWVPTPAEWIWLTATTFAGVAVAMFVAGHLAKRMLVPLNSLGQAIRHVAAGDLGARAVPGHRPLAEAAALVGDFNRLADQLQRVTEERTFWNAAIAHELRTPLTILRGRLQGLADGVFEPEPAQFRKLLAQVEGLGRLVEDLRAISLAESGHLDLRWQQADISRDIADAVDSFRNAFEAAGQTVSLQLHFQPVWCDPVRIRQAVVALLDNARRYAAAGTVTVATRVEDDRYVITVEDEGPGVPAEQAEQIFGAFRRSGEARDRNDRASGLGLAVVSAILSAHRGQASCGPSASGGTCFRLDWPLERR